MFRPQPVNIQYTRHAEVASKNTANISVYTGETTGNMTASTCVRKFHTISNNTLMMPRLGGNVFATLLLFLFSLKNKTFCVPLLFVLTPSYRLHELKNIPGANMEVVIFEVNHDQGIGTGDGSSVGSSAGSIVGGRSGLKEKGPISVCLWTPVKGEKHRHE